MLEDPNMFAPHPRSDADPTDSEEQETDRQNRSLLTPAKRAGLAALEREFADLLKKKPR